MTDTTERIRGRRGRDRRIAEAFEEARSREAAERGGDVDRGRTRRAGVADLSALTGLLAAAGELRALAERYARARDPRLGARARHVTYAAVPHGAKTYLAAALIAATGERVVWIARDAEIGDRVAEELAAWLGDPSAIVVLEPRTALAYERSELVHDETAARVAALAAWRTGTRRVLVASVQALFQHTIDPLLLPDQPIRVRRGLRMPQERLLARLVALGYESVAEVGGRGEFARRGGIVDLFPAGQPLPVRVEWFGDEIESLRSFDPADQRGTGPLDEALLLPASEFLLPSAPSTTGDAAAVPAGAFRDARADAVGANGGEGGADTGAWLRGRLARLARSLPDVLQADLARLEVGQLGDAAEIWAGVIAPSNGLDHIGDAIWLMDEPADIDQSAEFLWAQADERRAELEGAGELPKGWPGAYPTRRDWKGALHAARTLELTWESETEDAPPGGNPFGWREPIMPPAPIASLAETVRRWRAEGQRVVLTSDQSARLSELLGEADIVAAPVRRILDAPPPGALALVERSLNGGFSGGPDGLVVLTDRELFGNVRVRRPRALRRVVPRDILERLEPGDLVVHIDHGVARYAGLVRRPAGGSGSEERDFLELQFAGADRIWVPVEQINRVTRYAGGEQPQLSKLGGGEWARAKSRVRRAVKDLAEELIALYAARASVRARGFGPDTPWQQELEAAFPYEETRDQLRAVEEVKADLEREQPTDRLVVGDVGYGKTEVALRACFKAIQEGTQVALLVPTTVLAQQHFTTFTQRFAAYPVTVRLLSRFVPAAEQRQTIEGLANGSVDLVIGTHRLLSKDVKFRDLGLLVVDEEQRFGVGHKERLKQLRREVHVLTLSATPIPRTLNLALTGVRDMSVIETPPEDRLPIQTRVAEASAGLVRDAILRELDRGGQVFFVHNRVETIEAQAEQLRRLLPQARIAVAHGQMPEGGLERVMMAFARGDFDVLVCTTIIESGLDIPNANTIIIDRADALGLAQLYQLRGRVGRSSRRAYAYLLYRRRERLSDIARKRLQAIFNASELGAGFQIALSDLEIRGAGNILGGEQSGHMAAVGFDLYTRLLSEAVEEQKAQLEHRPPLLPRQPTVIDLPVDAYLPDDYVPEEPQKLELYRRLGKAGSEAEVDAVRVELLDRFGPVPPPVERLLDVARLRLAAERAGISSLSREDGQLVIRFPADWSRSATMRALSPVAPGRPAIPGVPPGGIIFASNQVRVRVPRDERAAWETTRSIVERLARQGEAQEPATV